MKTTNPSALALTTYDLAHGDKPGTCARWLELDKCPTVLKRLEGLDSHISPLVDSGQEFLRVVDALGESNVLDGWPVVREALAPLRQALESLKGGE